MEFTTSQKIWIVESFASIKSQKQVMNRFIIHYDIPRATAKHLYPNLFARVYKKFKSSGSVEYNKNRKRMLTARGDEEIESVRGFFANSPHKSTREAARALGISQSTVWRILSSQNMKPYHATVVQALSKEDMERRLAFSKWILAKDEMFPRCVVWTDEKNFVLCPKPNRRNSHYWSTSNPNELIESKRQSSKSVMPSHPND